MNNQKLVWYYNDYEEIYGPYTRSEILNRIKSGIIKNNYYIWNHLLVEWTPLGDVRIDSPELDSRITDEKQRPPEINKGQKFNKATDPIIEEDISSEETDSKSKLGAIMLMIQPVVSLITTILALIGSAYYQYGNAEVLVIGYNLIISIMILFIGYSILKDKKWSLSWGVGTSALTTVLQVISLFVNGNPFHIIFIATNILAFILIYGKYKQTKQQETDSTL